MKFYINTPEFPLNLVIQCENAGDLRNIKDLFATYHFVSASDVDNRRRIQILDDILALINNRLGDQ